MELHLKLDENDMQLLNSGEQVVCKMRRTSVENFQQVVLINDAPHKDLVEVIRCERCGYYEARHLCCRQDINPSTGSRLPYDYCSHAVKKKEEV